MNDNTNLICNCDIKKNNSNFDCKDCKELYFDNTNNELCSNSDDVKNFVYVEFKGNRKDFFLNYKNIKLFKDENIVVTAEIGIDFGRIIYSFNSTEPILEQKYNRKVAKTVIRKATDQDLERAYLNRCEEDDILERTKIIAQSFGLDMKVIDVE